MNKATKQSILSLRNFSVIGILSSIFIGILSYFLVKSYEISFMVSILCTLLTLTIDITRVLQKIDDKVDVYRDFFSISSSFLSIRDLKNKYDHSIPHMVMQGKLDLFLSEIDTAYNGYIQLNGWIEIDDVINQLAREVKASLSATCLWSMNPIKEANEDEYLNLLGKAMEERNVSIRRIYIIARNELSNPLFRERFNEDRKRGTKVRYLLEDQWSKNGSVPDPVDFGIWDKKVLWCYQGKEIAKMFFSPGRTSYIERYGKVFEKIWTKSKEDLAS